MPYVSNIWVEVGFITFGGGINLLNDCKMKGTNYPVDVRSAHQTGKFGICHPRISAAF